MMDREQYDRELRNAELVETLRNIPSQYERYGQLSVVRPTMRRDGLVRRFKKFWNKVA